MKTRAFVVRTLICLLLSMVPLTDPENFIYSLRFKVRGQAKTPSQVVIVEVPSGEFQSTSQLKSIQGVLQERHAAKTQISPKTDTNALIYDRDNLVRRAPSRISPALSVWINYRGSAGSIPRCTLREVENSSAGCQVDGKNVLLVDDIEDSLDLRTPLGEMSRAEVLANAWNTNLSDKPIHRVTFLMSTGLIVLAIVLAAIYVLSFPVVIHAPAVAGTGLLIVFGILQLIFEKYDVYVPSANLSLSMLITYLIFSGYRLAYQENLQWRSTKQAQYLRELDEMKTNFLSIVSHDLKTPIAKIQAVTERMKREMPGEWPSEWKEHIESIENSNNELKHTIMSLLNLSRIESKQVILNKKTNDINVLIRHTLKRLKPLAQQRNIQIEENLEPLFSVECDEDLMKQVISNLVDNAVKYSPPGSQVVVHSHEETQGKRSLVRVSVKDSGPGIPKDQLPLMFRKFSRLKVGHGIRTKGTGLGLYLSKYFIELHGGSIRVESIEGKGTTFSFTVPIEMV